MPSSISSPPRGRNVVTSVPTTGQTVAFLGNGNDQVLYLSPAGTLATLTVTLPANATSLPGQRASIASTQAITALTVNGAGLILNPITSMTASQCFTFVRTASDVWIREV